MELLFGLYTCHKMAPPVATAIYGRSTIAVCCWTRQIVFCTATRWLIGVQILQKMAPLFKIGQLVSWARFASRRVMCRTPPYPFQRHPVKIEMRKIRINWIYLKYQKYSKYLKYLKYLKYQKYQKIYKIYKIFIYQKYLKYQKHLNYQKYWKIKNEFVLSLCGIGDWKMCPLGTTMNEQSNLSEETTQGKTKMWSYKKVVSQQRVI